MRVVCCNIIRTVRTRVCYNVKNPAGKWKTRATETGNSGKSEEGKGGRKRK